MKEKRELLSMSQEDLAKKVSMSRQTINYIENGTKTPDLTKAFEIARALKTDVSELFIHVPVVQDLLSLDDLYAMWAEIGLDPKNLNRETVNYDALELLTLEKAINLAKRLNVDPEEIFEFNFEEKKKLGISG